MTLHRFFIDPIEIHNQKIELTNRDLFHRLLVTRISQGEEVELFNEREAYGAKLQEINKRKAIFTILKKNEVLREGKPKLFLIQSILKGDAMDDVIEKTTELGISGIIPCITNRVVPRIGNNKAKCERWQKLVLSAVIRSDRYAIPRIHDIVSLEVLDESIISIARAQGINKIFKVLLYENEKEIKLSSALTNKIYEAVFLMVGPEGGFEDSEVKALESIGFVSTQFSERVLTADVAAIGATALTQYLIGKL